MRFKRGETIVCIYEHEKPAMHFMMISYRMQDSDGEAFFNCVPLCGVKVNWGVPAFRLEKITYEV